MVGKGGLCAADDPELTPIATSLAAEGIARGLFAVDTLALSAKLARFRCLPPMPFVAVFARQYQSRFEFRSAP